MNTNKKNIHHWMKIQANSFPVLNSVKEMSYLGISLALKKIYILKSKNFSKY